ncbi:hypothetical protein AALA54_09410, partial [Oscillospiraceae bacterium 44-34]
CSIIRLSCPAFSSTRHFPIFSYGSNISFFLLKSTFLQIFFRYYVRPGHSNTVSGADKVNAAKILDFTGFSGC